MEVSDLDHSLLLSLYYRVQKATKGSLSLDQLIIRSFHLPSRLTPTQDENSAFEMVRELFGEWPHSLHYDTNECRYDFILEYPKSLDSIIGKGLTIPLAICSATISTALGLKGGSVQSTEARWG